MDTQGRSNPRSRSWLWAWALILAPLSAAIAFVVVPRTHVVETEPGPFGGPITLVVVPYSALERNAIVTVAAAGVFAVLLGTLALLPRMTTRRWLTAVAMVAALFAARIAILRRADDFRKLARDHAAKASAVAPGKRYSGPIDEYRNIHFGFAELPEMTKREAALLIWHLRLEDKYDQAAQRPWLPVAPDPPRPE